MKNNLIYAEVTHVCIYGYIPSGVFCFSKCLIQKKFKKLVARWLRFFEKKKLKKKKTPTPQ